MILNIGGQIGNLLVLHTPLLRQASQMAIKDIITEDQDPANITLSPLICLPGK